MAKKKTYSELFWTTVFVLIVCMTTISIFSGYHHSSGNLRSILITVIAVLMFHYMFGDPIRFALLSLEASIWPPGQRKFATEKEATHHNRLDYLTLRLQSLRAHLYIMERHRDEKLNCKYKHIAHDLWLYGSSLINAFHPEINHTGVSVWVHGKQTILLGVVRLRQLRLTEQHYGVYEPDFSDQSYMPEWKLPYVDLPYSNIYWRIYQPWVHRNPNVRENLWLNFQHVGFFRNYPELGGYVVLFARSRQNSLKILEYLQSNKWLNYNTSAVFLDFLLYNTDANILNVCTLRVEQTPFGSTIPNVRVESLRLLENKLSDVAIVLVIVYIIVFIEFFKALTVKLWLDPSEIRSVWNIIDLGIFMLNIILLTLIILREDKVASILKHIEGASKMEFIELRPAARLHMVIRMIFGFLICITTLRLWKVLQFSSVFQLFTFTLHLAWAAVASVALVIFVFILGFGVAVSTINGNNSFNVYRLSKSVVSCMCFACGFTMAVNTEDLFHGGKLFGILMFSILAFVISVMLINVFVSLINDYFSTAKDQRDTRFVRRISILQFMYAECMPFVLWWQKFRIFRKYYHRKNKTVSENIKRQLELLGEDRQKAESDNTFVVKKKISQFDLNLELEQFRRKQERIYTIGAIINTQIDILNII
ncbi:polycystin-2-like [Drosophila virilis]|uniref:polycystin-2-like n=1 Tax=Drosophila virilis TaxID=7244 RepID=UPI0013964403|nr:polycystin-2-like [Drosophila virilis]